MPTLVAGLWLVAAFLPLLLLERYIHRHLQGVWLLLFRSPDVATVLYALVMLPGVLLHEASHWVMATLLGARTGRFSVIPERLPDGTLRLGFVETEATDFFREALIGAAPLIAGALAVSLIGNGLLGAGPVGEALARGDLEALARNVLAFGAAPDAWVWIYLLFTVSNSMLPSASDRRAWLPLLVFGLVLAGVLAYVGLGTLVLDFVVGPVDAAIRVLAAAFTIAVALDLAVAPILWLLERGLMRVTGLRVEY